MLTKLFLCFFFFYLEIVNISENVKKYKMVDQIAPKLFFLIIYFFENISKNHTNSLTLCLIFIK
jgi:hypothetical protein